MNERAKEIAFLLLEMDSAELRDRDGVVLRLEAMGFNRLDIVQALHCICTSRMWRDDRKPFQLGFRNRVLGDFEKSSLSVAAQGYLINLRRLGLVSEAQLSTIIEDASMEFFPPVSLEDIKELVSRYITDIPEDISSDHSWDEDILH